MGKGKEARKLTSLFARIRQRPPAEQEAFKWLMLMALADSNRLHLKRTKEWEGRELYLFQEPVSGQWLAAFRPDINPRQEADLRQGIQTILKDIGPSPEREEDTAEK